MTGDGQQTFSHDDVAGLFAALEDPNPLVRTAALRALVRLPLDAETQRELRSHLAAIERYEYAWSTWLPEASLRQSFGPLLWRSPEEESALARQLLKDGHAAATRRFAQLALDDNPDPRSDEMLGEAQEICAEVERIGDAAVPGIGEIFSLYKVFQRRAATFWFDWTDKQRFTYDPASEVPGWFPMYEGPLAVSRQLEWLASRGGVGELVHGLNDDLRRGDARDRFAGAQLIEWARRAEGHSYPRFGGGSGPGDVLTQIPGSVQYKKFSPSDLPVAEAFAPSAAGGVRHETVDDDDSTATGERRISVWISEPDTPNYRPKPGIPCTASFRVGLPVAASLVEGPEGAVADADIPEAGLTTLWLVVPRDARLQSIEEEATVSASGAGVFELLVPKRGDSETRSLRVTPTGPAPGLSITIYVGAKRYRELEVSLDGVPQTVRDVATAPLADVDLYTTHEWTTPPGELELSISAPARVSISGNVNGVPVNRGDTLAMATEKGLLGPLVDKVRKAADDFRKQGAWTRYLNDVDPAVLLARLADFKPQYNWSRFDDALADDAHRKAWDAVAVSPELFDLARFGHRLYDALFKPGSDIRKQLESLEPGHRIDVVWRPDSPAGWVAHMPWELLYVDDPVAGAPVDPTRFWGLRFRVEYTAYVPSGPASSLLGPLPEGCCTSLLFFGDQASDPATDEAKWQRDQWKALDSSRSCVVPQAPGPGAGAKQELVRALAQPEGVPGPKPNPVAVLYLFCHYGPGTSGQPVLRFGRDAGDPNDVIRETEMGTGAIASRPLVFANACATSGTSVYSAGMLAQSFFDRECRAFIGSECMVPAPMASRFAMTFFHFLLRQVDKTRQPISAGESLVQARLFFWCHFRNIGGLLYSYLNRYDLYLAAQPELARLRKGGP